MIVANEPPFLTELITLLGNDAVRVGPDIEPRYHKAHFSAEPAKVQVLAVALPRSTEQVAGVLRLCQQYRQRVIPQGGMTGLAGGAMPADGEVVLSLERLRGVEELDPLAGTLTVWAGTPLEAAQTAAAAQEFLLAVDLGARGSCHVAGNVATNAGGVRVIRYGMTRQQVLGLEVVLADGTILNSLNKMQKNNAGYDLKQLFIGSEGTLGVITRVVFKLEPLPRCVQTAFCAVPNYAKAVAFLRLAQQRLSGRLSAFEVMWDDFYSLATQQLYPHIQPLSGTSPLYVLLDLQGADQAADAPLFEGLLQHALEQNLISDAALAQSQAQAQSFWTLRDSPAELSRVWPVLESFDVSLPIAAIGDYVEALRAQLNAAIPGAEALYFGHIADSNLHVCVTVPGSTEGDFPRHTIQQMVYGLVRTYGGSVSAEHGIGTHKKEYLDYSRSADEIRIMRLLKKALDPTNTLAPGRIFDPLN